jgi:rhodanese-related sulfurtransferase
MKTSTSMALVIILSITTIFGCASNSQSQSGSTAQKVTFENIDAKAFEQKIQEPNTVVLDVRTPEEVADGFIKGTTIFADINGNDFEQKMKALDKSKTYLVYCRSGARSSRAAEYLINNGFGKVYNLSGGILGWNGKVEKP